VTTLDECRRFYAEELQFAANLDPSALVEAFAHVLARCIYMLDLKTGDRVFHVGCGVGYYTAIIAEVVGSSGRITACEVDSDLAARANANLADYPNVTVHACDGAAFDAGTCDAMFINAGVTHPHLPWLKSMSEGGRIVLPLTVPLVDRGVGIGLMLKIVRDHGHFAARAFSEVGIYSCASVRDPRLEPLIGKALATKALLQLKSVRLDAHEQTDSCIVHGEDVCLSGTELVASQPESVASSR
jgi:protein-L-isoaspartate(D-aspartate) O-methyltransferase